MPYFLQHFSKNWVKTLVHGTLHKNLLVLGQNVSASWVKNVSARYFAQKVASFEEIDMFWWFFTKCHIFCNILLKIGSKP